MKAKGTVLSLSLVVQFLIHDILGTTDTSKRAPYSCSTRVGHRHLLNTPLTCIRHSKYVSCFIYAIFRGGHITNTTGHFKEHRGKLFFDRNASFFSSFTCLNQNRVDFVKHYITYFLSFSRHYSLNPSCSIYLFPIVSLSLFDCLPFFIFLISK